MRVFSRESQWPCFGQIECEILLILEDVHHTVWLSHLLDTLLMFCVLISLESHLQKLKPENSLSQALL